MNRYAPWRRDYATGAARLLVGLLLVWAAWRASAWFVVATGVLLILMGRANVARGVFRERGKAVEAQAVGELRRAVCSKVVVHASVPCPYGDVDALLRSYGMTLAIEIKAQRAVAVRWGRLVSRSPRAHKALAQALRSGRWARAQPVVWFPLARQRSSGMVDGVLVVCGPVRDLLRQAGIAGR